MGTHIGKQKHNTTKNKPTYIKIFTKGEIKEILKQDIESTETVENEEKQNNISTVHVEKNE